MEVQDIMKRLVIIGGAIITLGIGTVAFAQSAPEQHTQTPPADTTTIQSDVETPTTPAEETPAVVPDAQTPGTPEATTLEPQVAPEEAMPAPQEPAAEPQPEPVTLISCTRRLTDTGVDGPGRYEHYDDCTYSDGTVTSTLVGTSSKPSAFFG